MSGNGPCFWDIFSVKDPSVSCLFTYYICLFNVVSLLLIAWCLPVLRPLLLPYKRTNCQLYSGPGRASCLCTWMRFGIRLFFKHLLEDLFIFNTSLSTSLLPKYLVLSVPQTFWSFCNVNRLLLNPCFCSWLWDSAFWGC